MGLHRAFPDAEITGVDVKPMPRYPFRFVQADAMTYPLEGYDLIWTSPPCQGYSIMRNLPWLKGKDYPMLIEPIRERLRTAGAPYIIENVMGAQKKAKMHAGWLCGTMFGLPFYRHRVFETNWDWMQPGHPIHTVIVHPRSARWVYGGTKKGIPNAGYANWAANPNIVSDWNGGTKIHRRPDGSVSTLAHQAGIGHAKGWRIAAAAMNIDWMKAAELSQAIPPAYSQFLGEQLKTRLTRNA